MTEGESPADLERRFGGIGRLYGEAAARKIRAAHAVVVGIGGVGSWTAEALARTGLARLTLIDLDHVAESNINRQIHAIGDNLGKAKVLAMAERIAQINPQCKVQAIDAFVSTDNWPALLYESEGGVGNAPIDALVDACDHLPAKLVLASWALKQPALAFVSVGAAGGKRLAQAVEVADLAHVSHDPLLARLRQRLRQSQRASDAHSQQQAQHPPLQNAQPQVEPSDQEQSLGQQAARIATVHTTATHTKPQRKMGITCVFSREAVQRPQSAQPRGQTPTQRGVAAISGLNCAGYGSVVTVTASFGLCAASVVLERLGRA